MLFQVIHNVIEIVNKQGPDNNIWEWDSANTHIRLKNINDNSEVQKTYS